jgi:hypothetical protein
VSLGLLHPVTRGYSLCICQEYHEIQLRLEATAVEKQVSTATIYADLFPFISLKPPTVTLDSCLFLDCRGKDVPHVQNLQITTTEMFWVNLDLQLWTLKILYFSSF